MEYRGITSETLIEQLVTMQQALLQRKALPDVLKEAEKALCAFASATYIGISFLRSDVANIFDCELGDDGGLSGALHEAPVNTKRIYRYIRQLRSHIVVFEDGKLCRFFRLDTIRCERIESAMRGKKLLIQPLEHLDGSDSWAGIVLMLLDENAPIRPALETGRLLDLIVAPFYDEKSETYSQACIYEQRRFERLSPKEKEVALALLHGHAPRDIAQDMALSVNTVKTHIKSIYQKYAVNTQVGFISRFLKR